MKKIVYYEILILISVVISSCNKDNPVSTGSGSQSTDYKYARYYNYYPVYLANGYTYDSIICNVPPDNINAASFVRNVNLNIDTSILDATKLQIDLLHVNTFGTEISTTLLSNLTHPGTFVGTVLTDSSNVLIDSGAVTYTGRFKPKNPLNSYVNSTPSGKWKLRFYYTGTDKSGVIKSWSVGITYNSIQQPPTTGQILPLTVGNYWAYTNDTLSGTSNDTLFIPGIRYLRGVLTYQWRWSNYSPGYYWCTNNDNTGLRGLATSSDSSMNSILWYKYPVNVGDTNISKYWLSSSNAYNDTLICINTNATISTPSGIFTGCIVYQENSSTLGPPSTYKYYFKVGVGYLGQDKTTYSNTSSVRLSKYRVQ